MLAPKGYNFIPNWASRITVGLKQQLACIVSLFFNLTVLQFFSAIFRLTTHSCLPLLRWTGDNGFFL